jgi:hypothetical protein
MRITSFYLNTTSYNLDVRGSYLFLACGDSGLQIIDVKDPKNPIKIVSYDTPGEAIDIYVEGSYAYIADGYGGLRICNIEDPVNPYEVGYYIPNERARSLSVSNGYIYLVDEESFYILDFALTGVDDKNPFNKNENYDPKLMVTLNQISYSIKSENNEFVIFDIMGRVVDKEVNKKVGNYVYDLKELNSGFYIVKLKDNNTEFIKKVEVIK